MEKNWPDKLITELCNTMKDRRLFLGVSIYQISQASGVSQQAISNYEKLNRRPTLECLARVSSALGLKLSDLLAIAETRVEKDGMPESSATKRAKGSTRITARTHDRRALPQPTPSSFPRPLQQPM